MLSVQKEAIQWLIPTQLPAGFPYCPPRPNLREFPPPLRHSSHSLQRKGVKRLNLGVTMLYKLQSNRFYKNTRVLRKRTLNKKDKETDSLLCPFFPRMVRAIVILPCLSPFFASGKERVGLIVKLARKAEGLGAISVCFPK